MNDRTIANLIDLVDRVETHCVEYVWTPAVDRRLDQDYDAFRAGTLGTDDQNIYDVSRTMRWIASWNRRRALVADALVSRLPASVVAACIRRPEKADG